MSSLKVGDSAPQFNLPDQDGKMHALKDYAGQWVLLYFYPKDDTPGCTTEACALRDNLPKFKKLKAQIFGVSTDSVKSHRKFADKFELPFTLLADENKELVKAYDVYKSKKFMGREYLGTMRESFLIDTNGKIAKIYENVKPTDHADEVLTDLISLEK
ncbi:MAG: thioredoxin-dependent thiol peroxidase [Patescibacteria group bacterium]